MPSGDVLVLARTIMKVNDAQLKAMGPKVERLMQDKIYQLGRKTRDMARRLCPKKTGALAQSIYVTRPGPASNIGVASVPLTPMMTSGYFRAVNAAIHRSNHRLSKGMVEQMQTDEQLSAGKGEFSSEHVVHPRTQRPLKDKSGAYIGAFQSSIEKIGKINYKSYARGDELLTPTVMEMGASGRSSFFVTVGASAYYAGYVEFDHINVWSGKTVPGRPFLGKAIEWAQTQLPLVVKSAMEEGAKK